MQSIYQWFGGLFGFEVDRSVKFMFWLMSSISLFIIIGLIVRFSSWITFLRARQHRRGKQFLIVMALLILFSSCTRHVYMGGNLTDRDRIFLLEARIRNDENNLIAYREDLDGIHAVLRQTIRNAISNDLTVDSLSKLTDSLNMVIFNFTHGGEWQNYETARRQLGDHSLYIFNLRNQVDSLIKELRYSPYRPDNGPTIPGFFHPDTFEVSGTLPIGQLSADKDSIFVGDGWVPIKGLLHSSDTMNIAGRNKRKYPKKKKRNIIWDVLLPHQDKPQHIPPQKPI